MRDEFKMTPKSRLAQCPQHGGKIILMFNSFFFLYSFTKNSIQAIALKRYEVQKGKSMTFMTSKHESIYQKFYLTH